MSREISLAILGIIIFILTATLIVYLAGGEDVYGDDTENDLGLCINYHIQNACDRVDIDYYFKKLLNNNNITIGGKH